MGSPSTDRDALNSALAEVIENSEHFGDDLDAAVDRLDALLAKSSLSDSRVLFLWRLFDYAFTREWRKRNQRPANLRCDICLSAQQDTVNLVAGRHVIICDQCLADAKIKLFRHIIRNRLPKWARFAFITICVAFIVYFIWLVFGGLILSEMSAS